MGKDLLARLRGLPPGFRVALLCLLVLAVLNALLLHESGLSGDELHYERMATHPSGPHNFPYAYRVGVPWLVHLLPFSHQFSFTLLTCLASAASAGALYALLRTFEVDSRLALGMAIGFALSPPLLVSLLRHGRTVDPASVLVLTLGCLFIARRQKLALAGTVLAGITVRESSLFLVPLAYAVWAQRPADRQALRDVVLVALLPIVVYAVLRTSIVAVGSYSGSFLGARIGVLGQGLAGATWPLELRRIASAFGVLWLIYPFALLTLPLARRGLVLVLLCFVSMSYALDWGRIVFLAAPVIYLAAAQVLQQRRRLAVATLAAVFALDFGYAGYMQMYGVKHSLNGTGRPTHPVY